MLILNITVIDFGVRKSARYSWVIFVTELLVSGTQFNLMDQCRKVQQRVSWKNKSTRTLRQKFLTLWRILLKVYVQMEKRHSRLHFGLSAKVIHRSNKNKYYNLPKSTSSRIRYFLEEIRSTDPWPILNSNLNTALPVERRNAAKRNFCYVFLKTAWFQHKRRTGSFMWHLHFQSAYQFFQ